MSYICITGGCGYIGSLLVQKLLAQEHTVNILDNCWFGNFLQPHPNLTIQQIDIRHQRAYPDITCDAIIHLASVANDPCCDLDPKLAWEVNVLATRHLCEWAKKMKVSKFIFASSGSVYGVSDQPSVTEETELLPLSDYNKTKMIAERIVQSYKDEMDTYCIRPATVCGVSPRQRLDVAVNLLSYQALEYNKITVLGGEQYRPNLHIDDMTDLYLAILAGNIAPGIYNAGEENLTIKQIAEQIARLIPCEIAYQESNDPRSYRLDAGKLKAQGFRFQKGIQEAIGEIQSKYHHQTFRADASHYNVQWMKAKALC